jgi:hypothetical protein
MQKTRNSGSSPEADIRWLRRYVCFVALATLLAQVLDRSADHHIARAAVIILRNGRNFRHLVR